MTHGKTEAAQLGAWIARERKRRIFRGKELSTSNLAELANLYIETQKLPVKKIYQQEISKLENSTPETGPKRPQPWWSVLKEFIEQGALDAMLTDKQDSALVLDYKQIKGDREETLVRTPDGNIVGKIVWARKSK